MADTQPKSKLRGIKCQDCDHGRLRVVYTRPARGGKIVRCRECRNCRRRVITWEQAIGTG